MGFVTGLLDVLDVPATAHARLVELLCAKNEHELRKAALQAGADKAGADALCGLLTLHGPFGATLTAAKAAAISPAQKAALAELLALQNALGEAGRGLQLDLSMADEAEYYNGIVFTGYAAGIPRAVLKGGQYDYLMQRFTPGAKAIGFAMYLDELERLAAPLPPVQQQGGEKTWLNIALPKGRLGDKAYALLAGAGYSANEDYNDTRKLVVENPEAGVRYFLVKPSDVAIYVEHGAADIGIVGKDILTESGADVYELLDTGMGKCRMCVAGPKNFVDDESRALRVATKFVNIARDHYERRGRDIDIVKLNGSIELAPILGLSDVIVDIVETGTTHWTMFAAGGACLCLLQQLARRRSLPLGAAALCGAAAASGVELGVGLACRYLLHLAVWDYSALWGNVAGLVCPLYSFYWFLLCFWVLLVLRGAENLTERPLYRITKWAAEP